MKLTIIIPTFNESVNIVRTVESIENLRNDLPEFEIIIVDDCSKDGTPQIAEEYGFKVIKHKKNLGYARSIQTGFENASGEIVVTYNANGEYSHLHIPPLIQSIVEGSADIVIGSRLLEGEIKMGARNLYSGDKFLMKIMNLIYHTHLTDIRSTFIAFRVECFKDIICEVNDYHNFTLDILIKSIKAGLRITEIPVRVYPRINEPLFFSFRVFFNSIKIIFGV